MTFSSPCSVSRCNLGVRAAIVLTATTLSCTMRKNQRMQVLVINAEHTVASHEFAQAAAKVMKRGRGGEIGVARRA